MVRQKSENALSLRRNLVHALDRRAGRAFLGFMSTRWAGRTRPGVLIEYRQGVRVHRLGGYAFADSLCFDYFAYTIERWPRKLEKILSEAEDHWFFADRPAAGSVIFDVGAGKGEDCVAFSRAVGPNKNPATFQCLRASIELNGLSNVMQIHCAVIEKPRSVLIETAEDWENNSVTSDIKGGDRLPGIPLDDLVTQHNLTRIDLLKMNIEGAETLAIEVFRNRSGSFGPSAYRATIFAPTAATANSSARRRSLKSVSRRRVFASCGGRTPETILPIK